MNKNIIILMAMLLITLTGVFAAVDDSAEDNVDVYQTQWQLQGTPQEQAQAASAEMPTTAKFVLTGLLIIAAFSQLYHDKK